MRDERPLDGVHRYVLERLDKLVQCRVGLVCQHEKGRFWNARLTTSPLFGDVSQHFFALEPSRRCDGSLLLDKEIAVRIKDTQWSEHDGELLQRRVLNDRGAKCVWGGLRTMHLVPSCVSWTSSLAQLLR